MIWQADFFPPSNRLKQVQSVSDALSNITKPRVLRTGFLLVKTYGTPRMLYQGLRIRLILSLFLYMLLLLLFTLEPLPDMGCWCSELVVGKFFYLD